MQDLILFSVTVAMGFFAIMNPIGNMPIFIGLVDGIERQEQKRIAKKSVLAAFVIVTVFTVFGGLIFKLFGLSLPAFQIGGGILIFVVGYQLLNGKESTVHHPSSEEKLSDKSTNEDIAISPLAIPILAGPGTISTAMNFAGSGSSVTRISAIIVIFGLMCLITYFFFVFGEKIVSHIKKGILKVVTRMMGLIIIIISVQMVIEGIHNTSRLFM